MDLKKEKKIVKFIGIDGHKRKKSAISVNKGMTPIPKTLKSIKLKPMRKKSSSKIQTTPAIGRNF
jgi:hypothetical protein